MLRMSTLATAVFHFACLGAVLNLEAKPKPKKSDVPLIAPRQITVELTADEEEREEYEADAFLPPPEPVAYDPAVAFEDHGDELTENLPDLDPMAIATVEEPRPPKPVKRVMEGAILRNIMAVGTTNSLSLLSGRGEGIANVLSSDSFSGGTLSDAFEKSTDSIARILRLRLRRALRASPYKRPKTAAILQFKVRPDGTSTARLVRTSGSSVFDKRVLGIARGLKAPKTGGDSTVTVRVVIQ